MYILNEAIVIAYLPVTYRSLSSIGSSLTLLRLQIRKEKLSRIDLERDLNHIFEIRFAPLAVIAMKGIPCQTKIGKRVLLPLMLISCVADILEKEVLLGLKRGSKSPTSCYLCTASRNTFSFSSNEEQ